MSDIHIVEHTVLDLPSIEEMADDLSALISVSEPAQRCLSASVEGFFHHPDGRSDELGLVRLAPAQLALIAHLAPKCPTVVSVDVGFGMGTSATMTVAARRQAGRPFRHIAFDPWGLGTGAGNIVQAYLESEFPDSFLRSYTPSEVGLAKLLGSEGAGAVGMAFIDGNHSFEQVMVDFFLADKLCCVGGYIIFDDAYYPAIETAISYIVKNRRDYAVAHLPVVNTSVVQKVTQAPPEWCAFKPFEVSQRTDWTPSVPDWNGSLTYAQQLVV